LYQFILGIFSSILFYFVGEIGNSDKQDDMTQYFARVFHQIKAFHGSELARSLDLWKSLHTALDSGLPQACVAMVFFVMVVFVIVVLFYQKNSMRKFSKINAQ
jgi:type VI protein secretion system component VasF